MISVDRAYQTVQRLLNVEQRGQLPPSDFNHFGNLAQLDLFNQTMYDMARLKISPKRSDVGLMDLMNQQADVFVKYEELTKSEAIPVGRLNNWVLPADMHTVIQVYYDSPSKRIIIEEINHNVARYVINSRLTSPSLTFPKYERYSSSTTVNDPGNGIGGITILPDTIVDRVVVEYYRNPTAPVWAGTNVQGTELFNQTNSTDFELHPSLEDDLIQKILLYSAISTRQDDITQYVSGLMQQEESSEKN